MNAPLIVIIPGLGNGGVKQDDPKTWPSWVPYLINTILDGDGGNPDTAVPNAEFLVGSYTDPMLPETVMARKDQLACDFLIGIGHSDGACSLDWQQDHMRRLHEACVWDWLCFLDVVTDFLRHGALSQLDPAIVRRATRIFQRADPLIHSNPLYFSDGKTQVENLYIGDPPFNHPHDNHEDVAEDPTVHAFITRQISTITAQG